MIYIFSKNLSLILSISTMNFIKKITHHQTSYSTILLKNMLKFDFKKGEEIKISIINSGTVPLTFSDSSYGLRITGLFGVLMFTPKTFQEANLESYSLGPKEKIEFVWDQIKNDGDVALEGLYKIHSKGFDPEDKKVEKFTTITIWK